jgi:hypothetical protein
MTSIGFPRYRVIVLMPTDNPNYTFPTPSQLSASILAAMESQWPGGTTVSAQLRKLLGEYTCIIQMNNSNPNYVFPTGDEIAASILSTMESQWPGGTTTVGTQIIS